VKVVRIHAKRIVAPVTDNLVAAEGEDRGNRVGEPVGFEATLREIVAFIAPSTSAPQDT
jgi:hypothetical protein